ncbi:MAG: hypothetical protein IKQ06_00385 [Bacilli bacterium]|nr:hypothetical protein [Bacilli bacterium]
MDKDELEMTRKMNTMFVELDEEESILESIERFEDKLEYIDIPKTKKEKLAKLCEEIKKEEDENAREYLFKLLQKEID